MRVLAAMSGGVPRASTLRTGARGCCTVEDAHDARRAADVLGIPFYVWDFAERFTEDVVEDFVAEYAAGRTPNPCVRCNERIKFAALLDRAIGLGFDAVCTGHYARLSVVDGAPSLRRSADLAKDQSYVLASLRADQLRHAMFPLGDSTSKRRRPPVGRATCWRWSRCPATSGSARRNALPSPRSPASARYGPAARR